jgi:hypothetical protein
LCLLFSLGAIAQPKGAGEAVLRLDKALVQKDTATLKALLHPQLGYGHSNGWVQSREEVIQDLLSGKLVYRLIENKDSRWTVARPDLATVRSTTEVKYLLDGKEGELRLHVLQVWLKTAKGWQLWSRQSTKTN